MFNKRYTKDQLVVMSTLDIYFYLSLRKGLKPDVVRRKRLREWERPKPGRRPDIFPQFSPMKTPLPTPMPADPPEEDEDEEEKKEEEEEDPEKEEQDNPEKQ
ncbi:hypothetical protein KSS87_013982 [Heliosperma pusillum]|nr:hypothetical protein KSS87_013982 [Heliosperma pusillum]